MKGTIVGSYRILDTISIGGMGTVYRAEHTLLGRLAAIKILHPELCANRNMVNRFFNEAKATTSIKHPGIVEVFDFGYMSSGHAYLIMEFLEGRPLSHRVRARGPIAEGEAAALLRSVCIALSAAHDKGVIHRDLKPDNIIVMPDPDSPLGERTKILDFGIAKLTDIGLAGTGTKTGSVMGTPTYMSPEQCRGTGDVDCRADLYSIGCILYELVTGRPPFVNPGAGEVIGSHLFVEPEPPSLHIASVSPQTEALIMQLLKKQPEERVQTARELAQRLALIAVQHGWLAPGELSRPTLSHIAISVPAAPVDASTALLTPPTTPTNLRPNPAAQSSVPSIEIVYASSAETLKPTTLSGAAIEIGTASRRSRLGLAIAAGLVAVAAGAIGLLAAGGSSGTRPAAAADEARTQDHRTPTGPPAPLAAPVPPTAAPPAAPVAPPREPTTEVSASEPVLPQNAADEPAEPSMSAVPPMAAPSAAIRPTRAPAPAARPRAPASPSSPAAKPARKPARTPDKGSATESKDLLEQDI